MIQVFKRFKKFISMKAAAVATAVVSVFAVGQSAFAATTPATPPDLSTVSLPFDVAGMLTTATSFLTMYGQWILLALGVIFSPVLYGLAMKLVSAVKKRTAA